MRTVAAAVLFVVALPVSAAEADDPRWYAGATLGLFDVDYEDGDLPHFESAAYGVFLGRNLHRFLAAEFALERISQGEGDRNGNFRSSYQSWGLSPSLLLKFPFQDNDVEAYLRFGTSLQAYELESIETDGLQEDERWRPTIGGGLRGNRFFLEYLYYGEQDGLIMEELRVGLRFRW